MKSAPSPVLVISNLDKDASSISDLLSRFDNYGKAVAKTSGLSNSGLNIFSRYSRKINQISDLSLYANLDITSVVGNIFKFIIKLHRALRKESSNISIVIAGDPWIGFLICKLATYGLGMAVQVSIHGEPYLKSIYLRSFRSFLKDIWLRCFLRYADSVRLVSAHQIEHVKNRYHVIPEVISICPIPVSIPNTSPERKKGYQTIAFVGRLHKERGINTWIEVTEKLSTLRKDFKLLVIGDGPERKTFEQALSYLDIEVDFLGKLDHSEVQALWPRISILLSTAPSEGFGLALREAQLSGTYVVALENEGTLENKKCFPMGITLFRTVESAFVALSERLDSPNEVDNVNHIRRIQKKLNEESLAHLVQGWRIAKS